MAGSDTAHRFDHVVSVMFENRSFDNLLGYLYEPGEVAAFEGVAGRDLSNPIPSYAPGAERGAVPVHVATSMDAPNPDAGEEHPHTNTQLFGTVSPEGNRFLSFDAMQPPFNAPEDPRREPTMDGFVLDYINTFRSEMGRLPEYDEYAQIMSVCTPDQVPRTSTVMGGETRLERLLDKWIARATTPRGAAIVIASVTTVMTVVTGLLMTVIDHDNFPSLGGGLWWAIQTVTTVGYGDAVPETTGGRLLAALVMLLGIGFLTVITAAITSTFVARSARQPQAGSGDPSAEQLTRLDGRLERIDERLERIEAALRERR